MDKFYIELYPKADLENEWTKNKHTPGAMPCMRCGGPMRESLAENALSRAMNVYVCPACGMDEALQDAARKVLPIFQKEGGAAYHEQTFPAFLEKWKATFGKERCMFVLACTMRQRTGDGRFYPPAREAAAKFRAQMDRIANRVDDYAVNTHSCIVNAAMEYLARPERSKEKQKGQFQPER